MPSSVLSFARVRELLADAPDSEALVDRIFLSKAEVEGREGDALRLSVTPDRLDLLSEGGLALSLQGSLGSAQGTPKLRRARARAASFKLVRDPSVEPVRPAFAGVVVRAPTGARLDEGTLAEAVRFQEIVHATIGRDRRAMSLGIYPARKLASPVRYTLEPVDAVRFVPLHQSSEIAAARFFGDDPMAARYGSLGRAGNRCLTLRDAGGHVLSLPPVLNSATGGEARAGDRVLLLEATGTRLRSVLEGLGLLLVVFAARGWSVEPLVVEAPDGTRDPAAILALGRPVEVPTSTLRAVSGEIWSAAEIADRFARARLSSRRVRGGWRVVAPPWRPDLLTGVDVAEDALLAKELRPDSGVVPPSATLGRRRDESRFRRRIARWLLGLGFPAPHSTVLASEEAVLRLGDPPTALALDNPVSREFAYLRDRLLIAHLEVLGRNTRSSYPQRFAEVGPVVVRDPKEESGAATRYHAGIVIAGDGQGFADAAALADYLLRALDVGSVREPAELPGTIPGRAARVRVAGEPVAEIGEIHPKLLAELGVPVPVAWTELDLTALWPLAGGRVTH